jgi:hypothetical protein
VRLIFCDKNSFKYFSRYIDGHQVNNDEKMNDTLLITTDSLGSYLTFNETLNVGEKFKKTHLNIACVASTTQGKRSHSTVLS